LVSQYGVFEFGIVPTVKAQTTGITRIQGPEKLPIVGFNKGRNGKTAEEIRNKDQEIINAITEQGYHVHRIWEHEIKELAQLKERLAMFRLDAIAVCVGKARENGNARGIN
jgi:hypothetical protein